MDCATRLLNDADNESLLRAIGDGIDSQRPSSISGSFRVVMDSLILRPPNDYDDTDDTEHSSGCSGTTITVDDPAHLDCLDHMPIQHHSHFIPLPPHKQTPCLVGRSSNLHLAESLSVGVRHNLEQNTPARSRSFFRPIFTKPTNHDCPPVSTWVRASWILTCCIPAVLLKFWRKGDPYVAQAFREKLALCFIILLLMAGVGFLTFGFQNTVCNFAGLHVRLDNLKDLSATSIRGVLYSLDAFSHPPVNALNLADAAKGHDMTLLWPPNSQTSKCAALLGPDYKHFPCVIPGVWPPTNMPFQYNSCHTSPAHYRALAALPIQGSVYVHWETVAASQTMLVFNGFVLDLTMLSANPYFLGQDFYNMIQANIGKDATKHFSLNATTLAKAQCLDETFRVGEIDSQPFGCVVSNVVLYVSLIVIVGVVLIRFILAITFSYLIGSRLGDRPDSITRSAMELNRRKREWREIKDQDLIIASQVDDHGQPLNPYRHRFPTVPPQQLQMHQLQARLCQSQSQSQSHSQQTLATATTGPSRSRASNISSASSDGTAHVDETDLSLPRLEYSRHSHIVFGRGNHSNTGLPIFPDPSVPDPAAAKETVMNDPELMHVLVMITCYSEPYVSLRTTLDSISNTYYPATHKCLFVVADGIVTGEGNGRPTSDFLIDMMEVDDRFRSDDPRYGGLPEAYSYLAIADGARRKNFARVYAGWYRYTNTNTNNNNNNNDNSDTTKPMDDVLQLKKKTRRHWGGLGSSGRRPDAESEDSDSDSEGGPKLSRHGTFRSIKTRKDGRVPMILVVKCGNPDERVPGNHKPGNRGKRDSQVLVMNFLSKVLFDDRLTELEFDMVHKLWAIGGVHPQKYESILMVDADTKVYPDCITHMVACMLDNPRIMGLCGETRIANKFGSWVTMIQVFEYYISHHLTKAFESVFGGVTCLPGCFCMYRIKALKYPGQGGVYVPLLANPDVVEQYSENVVDTLHKKNLLLLGEDRFLSTLMLKNFPHRKMIFVPQAVCKTVVPDQFKVLLSQRRRWINSTVHNLLELVLVRDLCGIFCFSMQFVIFMELVGTVVLPAAISFTIFLLIESFVVYPPPYIPLGLLAAILGLPALLIIMTAHHPMYIFWMLIYLVSLPIWNFVLPVYAFWHFDDFSWGQTRQVAGEKKGEDHSRRTGDFDGQGIQLRRVADWINYRKMQSFDHGCGLK
ncbi:chitin synthase [Synchytrium endobioticum]|uniref:chitin synthase n=1 Tax=Synchytrium endobioticum TaxID=286115 RepID=A0A507CMF2_9FUNG|nr:chitin synthase [Synchytrium endobioticum]TPX51047.1 chitin synthase [Synchytrium endobioticum]